jgi:4-amino-4-deoxy-L-arabinose transferase-like glycosyltransferase
MDHPTLPSNGLSNHLELAGLALVLALAAVLRLGWPGVNSFGYDEARVSQLALQMARDGSIPVVGIASSAGVPNPPAFVWLMSIPFAVSRDPLFATSCIALVNILFVLGVWALARRAWGPWAALTAGLIYASAPYGVLYSRSIWSQDLLAPFAVLWAWCAVQASDKGSGPALALHVLIAGLAWQVHYSGVVLIPATVWLVLQYRLGRPSGVCRRNWCWLLVGGLVPAVVAVPFALAVLTSANGLAGVQALLDRAATWNTASCLLWAEVGTGSAWEWLPLGWDWRWPPLQDAALTVVRWLTATLIAFGAVFAGRAVSGSRPGSRQPAHVLNGLVLMWAAAAPLMFLRSSTPVYHQYMLAALPALALLAGRATASEHRRLRALVLVLSMAIALIQGKAVEESIRANATELHVGGMGTPLSYPRAMATALRDGAPVYSHGRSDNPEYDADAAAAGVLFWGYPHRIIDGEAALLLPPEGERASLLFMFPDSAALAKAREYALIDSETRFPRRRGEPPYTALQVSGASLHALQPTEGPVLANGVALAGWRASRQGNQVQIVTCWRITEDYVPGVYHQFNHLYAEAGETPLAVQDAAPSSAAWAAGNRVLTWASFETEEPGPLYVEVGLYTYPDITRVAAMDGATSTRLGPIP